MDNNEVVAEEVAAVVENNTGIEIEPLFEEQVDFDTFSKSDFRVVKVKNCEAVPKSKKLLRFTLDDGTKVLYDTLSLSRDVNSLKANRSTFILRAGGTCR